MRILMLGWEFPPFIAGGLGTACYGLTRALDRLGHEILFILPKPVPRAGGGPAHMLQVGGGGVTAAAPMSGPGGVAGAAGPSLKGFEHTTFQGVPANFSSPYPMFDAALGGVQVDVTPGAAMAGLVAPGREAGPAPIGPQGGGGGGGAGGGGGGHVGMGGGAGPGYGSDLVGDSERYARLVVSSAKDQAFDVIHAHDWLTYPAGLAIARVTGRPLCVHVHSTEFDRSGSNVNQRIYEIERAGMHGADRVIAVSNLTKSICVTRYGVPESRIDVCYNGVEREASQPAPGATIESDDKIVLFLGRITMQKGPEYFIAAAKRVLEKVDRVKFVLAGSGDMALRMIELAANMGIGHKVLFTGFLRGKDVERVFQMADCYVMPSVSEPFGIAALEAIHHDVPVIISKTSGAAEVLTHVLKVDFWDIDEMANKIIAVLRHPPLSQTLRQHGSFELHRLTWDGAAERCVKSYQLATRAAANGVARP
ncbi:MAG: glycosyltransferase [Phycisphaerales bacterium]|nr:glycosyltransferase [Phycisphaerales bacterium]